ncbi:MAG: hypothetical protein NC548_42445, partial [Lachnospiraceae bacterium]|nr:hypothetical protein [Lachnospiraceae bacterium]
GDGKAEKITLSQNTADGISSENSDVSKGRGSFPYDNYRLQAGEDQTGENFLTGSARSLSNCMWVFSPDGNRIFLALYAEGSGIDPETLIFSYSSGKLTEAGRIQDDLRYCTIEDGLIRGTTILYDAMMPLYIETFYRIEEDGKIKQEYRETIDLVECQGELLVSLPLHTAPGSEEIYYLEPQSVTLMKTDSTHQWLYLEGENGEGGWFYTEGANESRIAELDMPADEVFELYYAG